MKQNERHKQILPGASRATRAPPPVHQNSQGHPKTKTMQNAHFLFALGIIAILCLWCPQRRSGGVYIANGRLEKRFNLLTFYGGDSWQSIAFQRKKKKDWAHGRGGWIMPFRRGTKIEADESDAPSLLLFSAIETVDHGRPSSHGVPVPRNTHDLHSHGVDLRNKKGPRESIDTTAEPVTHGGASEKPFGHRETCSDMLHL